MKKFLENFWYYHKWKLLVALMVVMVVVNTVSELSAVETFDHSIAVVTMSDVSEQVCQDLSLGFSQILPDTDADSQVTVQVNVYHYGMGEDITPTSLTEDDAVHLAADIRVGMSSIFLTDEPEVFADAGFVSLGLCSGCPALAFLPDAFSGFAVFAPEAVSGFVMEALS